MTHHTTSGVTRRSVLVGACAACGVAVAGCASYGSGGAGAAPPPPPPPPPAAGGVAALVSTADVPVGGGVIFADQDVVVTQPAAGTFKAFTATCTHTGCTVANVNGGTINCTCHGSKYDVTDGSVVNGPAPQPLTEKPITVSGDAISLA